MSIRRSGRYRKIDSKNDFDEIEFLESVNVSSSEIRRSMDGRFGLDSTTSTMTLEKKTRQSNNVRHPLTVKMKSKIDRLNKNKIERAVRPSKLIVLCKWFATFVLGVIILSCLTLSKVTLIGISSRMQSLDDPQRKDRCFTMLLLILLVPTVFGFIRAFWIGGFRKDIKWPSRNAIIKGIVFSIIEAFGLCVFVVNSLKMGKSAIALLFTNAVLILPIGEMVTRSSGKSKALFIFAFLLELGGIGVVGYLNSKEDVSISDIWHPIAGIVCMSIAWLPKILKQMVVPSENDTTSDDDDLDSLLESGDVTMTTSNGLSNTGGNMSGSRDSDERTQVGFTAKGRVPVSIIPMDETAVSWKGTIIYSLVKIPAILIFAFILYFVDHKGSDASAAWEDFQNAWDWSFGKEVVYFIINTCCSVVGYGLALTACQTCMERGAFGIPICLSTPLACVLLLAEESCNYFLWNDLPDLCYDNNDDLPFVIVAIVLMSLAQGFVSLWIAWNSKGVILQPESKLVWLPTYNGVLLDQWLIVNRRNIFQQEPISQPRNKAAKTRVFICTTMYRETKDEMKQLLESISRINSAQAEGDRHFESHVFFDGGVKDKNPSERVLQLVSLLKSTLGVEHIEDCTKTTTPYGLSLSWRLPLPGEDDKTRTTGLRRMFFKIHLKDNRKVKNKKRWSQIMYMSYVLDFLSKQNVDQDGNPLVDESDTFILTTDADVKFTPDSVEALLDLMTRDPTVGAVCARTHPQGMGPLVWYQTFEYAIGHWFQKAAEHVLGSVLCAPGCFSVYRCSALRDILPTYASNVENAFDFLIKDMGEDRWLCTLMVQSGWRIEYCAASENFTNCPAEFEEFYKQRRRWIASTIANLMTILREWTYIKRFNNRVSMLFLLYQAILLFSTLIGPGTVTLIVSGGLVYAWDVSAEVTVILQFIVCFIFAAICLYASQSKQMLAGKIITFLYSMVMTAVAVGTAVQVANDFSPNNPTTQNNETVTPTPSSSAISIDFPVSTTTIYLLALIGMFFATALLHTREFLCLVHGIWYLLCLPSAYLVLIIYSVCNITDRSWGTREEKEISAVKSNKLWHEDLRNVLKNIFFCCDKTEETVHHPPPVEETEQVPRRQHTASMSEPQQGHADGNAIKYGRNRHSSVDVLDIEDDTKDSAKISDEEEEEYIDAPDRPIPVDQWLEKGLKVKYLQAFIDNGYENTLFISGMTEKELKYIGVKKTAHIKYLLDDIKNLPDFEIETYVPRNAEDWLETIGLSQYLKNFKQNKIYETKEMEVLKGFGKKEIEKELGIEKVGHIKRLKYAITKLRNPTDEERTAITVRKELENATTHSLRKVNTEEFAFWADLKSQCLEPYSTVFGLEEELKKKLGGLRNQWLMILACTNSLWIILIVTLAAQANLTVIGSNPIGLVFLFIFGSIFVLQFLAMLIHRFSTLTHFLARAPYRFNEGYNTSWAFVDLNMPASTEDDIAANNAVKDAERKSRQRLKSKKHSEAKNLLNNQTNHTNHGYNSLDVV